MELFDNIYNGQAVSFDFGKDQNVMVNATEMARIFDKQVVAFLRNETTKSFIKECLKSENSHFLKIKSEEDLILSKQKTGTWMHRVLAIKFAAWLDPAFELWVYMMIDKIMFEYYRNMEQSIQSSARRRIRIDQIRNELGSNELYIELQELELEERQAAYRRGKGNRQQVKKQMKALSESAPDEDSVP